MLILRSKTPVKFEFTDGLSETTVSLQPDDDTETVRAKLQRVLDLEAGQGLPTRQPGAALQAAQAEFPPLYDAQAAEAALAAKGAMGWDETELDIDTLPEAG